MSKDSDNIAYNRIKAVLAEKRVQNQQLAAALNVTTQAVSAWCTNTKQPSIHTLYAIAQYLRIDIRELLVPTTNW